MTNFDSIHGAHPDLSRQIVKALYGEQEVQHKSILMTDVHQPDMPIIYCSPGFEKYTGYSPDEVLGKNARFLQGKETSPIAVAMFRHLISNRLGGTVHIKNYKKSGESFLHQVKLTPIFTREGDLRAYIAEQSMNDGYLPKGRYPTV